MKSTWTLRGMGCCAALAAAAVMAWALGDANAAPAAEKRPAQTKELTFDDIKFEMTKEEPFERKMITDDIEKLAGKRVRIHGYILPSFQQEGLTQFVLVRDNMECCFGPGAALFDCIIVNMAEGTSASFTTRPVAVEGTFKIEILEDPIDSEAVRPLAIYQLDGEAVE